MAVSDQELLDAAKERLLKLLGAGVQEFTEGPDRARMLEIDKLQKTIDYYEQRVAAAAGPRFLPVKIVDV